MLIPEGFHNTGYRIGGKPWWLHVVCMNLLQIQLTDFETRYDAILKAPRQTCPVIELAEPTPRKRGKPKQHPAKNLLEHLQLRKMGRLAFMYDF